MSEWQHWRCPVCGKESATRVVDAVERVRCDCPAEPWMTADRIPDDFGGRVHWQRQRRHMSLRQLAKRAGLNASDVSRYERGIGDPSLRRAIALAEALGVSLSFLVGEA